MEDRFFKMPLAVARMTKLVDKDGKEYSFSPTEKLVYCYMLARIQYFCVERKGVYYDSQEDIAEALGLTRLTARKAIKKLLDCGIIQGKKIPLQGNMKWVYTKAFHVDTKIGE